MNYLFLDAAPLVTLENITALEEEMTYVTHMRNLIHFRVIDGWNSGQKYFHQILLKDEDLIFFLACFKRAMIQHANSSIETSDRRFCRYLNAVSDKNVFVDSPDVCNLHYHANNFRECNGTLFCTNLHRLLFSNKNIAAFKSFKPIAKRRRICDASFLSNFSMLFIFELHEDWSCCTGHEINLIKCRNISLNDGFYDSEYTSQNAESPYFWHRMFDNEVSLFTGDLKKISSFVRNMKGRSKLKRANVFDQIMKRERGECFNKLMVLDTIVSPYYYLLPYQNKSEYEKFENWNSFQNNENTYEYVKILFVTFPLQVSRHEILIVPGQF